MPVSNDIKEQRAKLKGAPFKDKWQYFLDYYKWPTIGIIAAIIAIIFFTRDVILSNKPVYIEVLMLNSYSTMDGKDISKDFALSREINLKKYQVHIDTTSTIVPNGTDETSYLNQQRVFASIMAADLDCMLADEAMFHYFSVQEAFDDLRNNLSPEQLEEYQDLILYETYEGVEEPVPIGIEISHIPFLSVTGSYIPYEYSENPDDDQVYFGIITNSSDKQHALEFLDYILSFQLEDINAEASISETETCE